MLAVVMVEGDTNDMSYVRELFAREAGRRMTENSWTTWTSGSGGGSWMRRRRTPCARCCDSDQRPRERQPALSRHGAVRSPFTLRSDGRLVLNIGYLTEAPAWRDWIPSVLSTLGLHGETRRYPEVKPAEWVPHARRIVELTQGVLRR